MIHRAWDSFAGQCNAGLSHIETSWVLSCDADYIAESTFAEAIRALPEGPNGWRVPFIYCIHGHKLRSGLYPPRICLYQKEGAIYHNDGHGHKVSVPGEVRDLPAKLLHDDRKPLARWLNSQLNYARQEAEKLSKAESSDLGWPDKLRMTGWANPFIMLIYCLFWRRGILDGWAGWRYAAERTFAELLLCLHLLEEKLTKRAGLKQ